MVGLLQLVERFGGVAALLEPLVFSLLPVGVLLGVLRSQARSGVVGSLVTAVEPRSDDARDRLEPLLARALGDPSVLLLTPAEASAGEAAGRLRTAVTSRGRTLAVLEHDPELASEPEVLAAVLATASLALENERLGALARAQLAEVAESRRRLVTAQMAERRRLERDLHDGAQQRLVTVRLMLAMAVEQGVDSDLVAQATALVEETTAELRDLARGVHPSVVTEQGLAGAMEALAERAAVAVELRGDGTAPRRARRGDGVLRRRRGPDQHGQARERDPRRGGAGGPRWASGREGHRRRLTAAPTGGGARAWRACGTASKRPVGHSSSTRPSEVGRGSWPRCLRRPA